MPTEQAIITGLTNSAPTLALVLVSFIGGVMVPFPYAMERFRGFGRVMLSKLPYAPPPGEKAEAALVVATAPDDPGTAPDQASAAADGETTGQADTGSGGQ